MAPNLIINESYDKKDELILSALENGYIVKKLDSMEDAYEFKKNIMFTVKKRSKNIRTRSMPCTKKEIIFSIFTSKIK